MIVLNQNPIKIVGKWIAEHKTILLMFFFGAILIAAPTWFVVRGGGDDTNFLATAQQYDLWQYLVMRYFTWSGRFFGEFSVWIIAQFDLIVWKIINIIFYLVQSYLLYCYYLLFAQKYNQFCVKTDPVALIACLVLPFSMDFLAIKDSVFWVTGSSYYLWPVALGLVGFYPTLRYVLTGSLGIQNKAGQITIQIICFLMMLCGLVTCEQLGAIFVAFYLLFNIYYGMKHKRVSVYLLWQFLLVVVFYLIATKAPGVGERVIAETQNYIPDFQSVALSLKLNYSIRWFFDAIINQMGILLPAIWILLCVFVFKKSKKFDLLDLISVLCFFLGFVVILLRNSLTGFLFDFQASWGIPAFGASSYLPMLFWAVLLIMTLIELVRVGDTGYEKLGYLFVALGIACSIGVIVFSPTMYASGDRTKYIPSIFAILLIFMLYAKLKQLYWKTTDKIPLLLLLAPIGYGFAQYFYAVSNFSDHFMIH